MIQIIFFSQNCYFRMLKLDLMEIKQRISDVAFQVFVSIFGEYEIYKWHI